jgi:hypothetical protein
MPAGTATKEWTTFVVRIASAMTAGTKWRCIATSNIGAGITNFLEIFRSAGGVYNFVLADNGDAALATGATGLTMATNYTCKLTIDVSGANRIVTLYLWNGSAWVSEVTFTDVGVAGGFVATFGQVRAKGVAGSGAAFYINNIYTTQNLGSYENTDPISPVYLLGLKPVAVGTYDEWPGNAADVDDVPDNDGVTTTDECGTGTAAERQTYAMLLQTANIPAGQEIACVAIYQTSALVAGSLGASDAIFKLGASDTFDSLVGQPSLVTYIFPLLSVAEQSPAGGAWAVSDMGNTGANANVELGHRRQAAASDPRNVRLTMLAGYVAYRAAAAVKPFIQGYVL